MSTIGRLRGAEKGSKRDEAFPRRGLFPQYKPPSRTSAEPSVKGVPGTYTPQGGAKPGGSQVSSSVSVKMIAHLPRSFHLILSLNTIEHLSGVHFSKSAIFPFLAKNKVHSLFSDRTHGRPFSQVTLVNFPQVLQLLRNTMNNVSNWNRCSTSLPTLAM